MTSETVSITRRNSAYQILEALLANRQKRHATRTFLVEGVQPINMALTHGWKFAAVIHRRGAALSSWATNVIERASAPMRYQLAGDLLDGLSRKDEGSELLAVLQMPPDDLERIPVRPDLLVGVIDRPANPGNLGTLIRSCDAFGAHGLLVSGHAVDIYDPATITASRGSLFVVPVVRVKSPGEVAAWLTAVRRLVPGCRAVAADERAERDIAAHDFSLPTVAVFGNEARGVSRAYRELCDAEVRIPMLGAASSLNLGVAASIVFYEVLRQRQATSAGVSRRAITTS